MLLADNFLQKQQKQRERGVAKGPLQQSRPAGRDREPILTAPREWRMIGADRVHQRG